MAKGAAAVYRSISFRHRIADATAELSRKSPRLIVLPQPNH
jgi:hypothetical protein